MHGLHWRIGRLSWSYRDSQDSTPVNKDATRDDAVQDDEAVPLTLVVGQPVWVGPPASQPSAVARATASARLLDPNLTNTRFRCDLTVSAVISSVRATPLFDLPCEISASTVRSRGLNCSSVSWMERPD